MAGARDTVQRRRTGQAGSRELVRVMAVRRRYVEYALNVENEKAKKIAEDKSQGLRVGSRAVSECGVEMTS